MNRMKMMNEPFQILHILEVSDMLNILLIIVTLGTVRYASKTLLMEYSSQILVSKFRMTFLETNQTCTWEVDIENKGKGYVVKGFILLTIYTNNNKLTKEYHLSQPLFDIEPGEKDIIKLVLNETDVEDTDLHHLKFKLEVYYQDALNNIYIVTPGTNQTNRHLEKFEKLPRKIVSFSPTYFLYKYKFKRAVQQENTFVVRQQNKYKKKND